SRRIAQRRDVEPHRGGLVLTFGILSLVLGVIGLFFGIAAWVMGGGDLKRIDRGEMDAEGRGTTQARWICGIIRTCLQSLSCLVCIGYLAMVGMFLSAATSTRTPTPAPAPAPANTKKVEVLPSRPAEPRCQLNSEAATPRRA